MYYLVYRQSAEWCKNDMITTRSFQSEEKVSKFLNTLDEDKKNGWMSEIFLLVKGDRMKPFKQNVYAFSFPNDRISALTEAYKADKGTKDDDSNRM
jgi:hypothetical protein